MPLHPDIVDLALCSQTDPELFFAENGNVWQPREARKICSQCPIAKECLESALLAPGIEDYGIWAGTTPKERVEIRRKRKTITFYLDRLKEYQNENNKEGETA